MATVIRMARGGSKKNPFYRIVVTNSRSPRDSHYIERLGTYNPNLAKDNKDRVILENERISYWLGQGAAPSETVARFLRAAGLYSAEPAYVNKAKGSNLKKKALDAKTKAEEAAAKAAEEAAKPKEEAPAAEAAPEAPAA